ncbi:MAG: hypothetical protein KF875_03695 [Trueperaceae bacterium]|nr:hypothetical protein [Trueperaceae bacterium]
MAEPRQTPETALEDAKSTALPSRPGEPPTASGMPVRHERAAVARWASWRAYEDVYEDRPRPMSEMP